MFGGDWPVCTLAASYKAWYDALGAIVGDCSTAEQRRLFHDNAARVYRIGQFEIRSSPKRSNSRYEFM
jgi:L-fuconolactonase